MKDTSMRIAGILFVSGLLAAAAVAGPITIANASFETLPPGGLTSGCAGTNCAFSPPGTAVPGWMLSPGAAGGQFQPGNPANTNYYNTNMPDGITLAYLNSGSLSQPNVATVALGVLYTLMVDIGFRKDGFGGNGQVFLQIGSTNIAATGAAPASGAFSTLTATYTGVLADLGASIGVLLSTPATGQGDFDNVRLNSAGGSTVPEPAGMALMGAGLAAIVLLRRKLTAR